MQMQEIALELLTENPDNPNRMEPEKLQALSQAIKRLGFLQPPLVRARPSDFLIVDGHHRVAAARLAEITSVPCVLAPASMTDAEAKAAMLGLNRLRGELDLALASGVVIDLAQAGWSFDDLAVTGFSEVELKDLLDTGAQNVDDLLRGAAADVGQDDEPRVEKPFVLEVMFASREQYVSARKALKRAAGKGGDLSRGLLTVLGLES
jgi:ParB-like chromosome segregation protein Spo0J